ncbi:MAG TPA: outer membrane beta-barrel protein [Planctomycetota bacterium]|nr:outer membrane beta-barrel protein [Planctomycetota bacterium]
MTGVAKAVTAGFITTLLATQAAWGQDSQDSVDQLKKDVQSLQEKVKALETQSQTPRAPLPGMPQTVGLAEEPMMQAPPDVTVLNTWLKDIKLSGFLDVGYTVNINNPKNPVTGFNNVDRSFDTQSNTFMPNMMELMLERVATADSPAGLRLKIGAGRDAAVLYGTENWGTGAGSNFDLVELYAEYLAPIGKGIDFKVGKMATLAGFEVIESKDNWSYSRSIIFTYAIPLTHTGLRATYSFWDLDMAKGVPGIAMTVGVNNGWNDAVDNNTGKTLEWQLSLNPVDWISAAATIYWGDDPNGGANAAGAVPGINYSKRFVFDWVTTVTRGDWKFGVNFDYGSQDHGDPANGRMAEWSGVAGYIRWQMTHWFAPSIRIETMRDEDGFIAAGQGSGAPFFTTGLNGGGIVPSQVSIREATWANEMMINPNLTFRIELRHDWSTKYIFQEGGNPNGKKSENTLAFEAIFKF